ncbi:MAG: hypothetical protein K9H25_21160 [Rhodospirillum sp.]|nr:hypothetical protein [Rhodospirillum sp.]MCF8491438.1 hypothetical protein [Rhodospirillum sp.]MCF8500934.1 hypothetical protein [Rhodospirillum sp.]
MGIDDNGGVVTVVTTENDLNERVLEVAFRHMGFDERQDTPLLGGAQPAFHLDRRNLGFSEARQEVTSQGGGNPFGAARDVMFPAADLVVERGRQISNNRVR